MYKTSTYLFLSIGVSLGSRSLMGGVILVIPITLTIAFSAPSILPSTSGYSSPRYSYNTTPKWPINFSCNTRRWNNKQIVVLHAFGHDCSKLILRLSRIALTFCLLSKTKQRMLKNCLNNVHTNFWKKYLSIV